MEYSWILDVLFHLVNWEGETAIAVWIEGGKSTPGGLVLEIAVDRES